MNVKDFFNVSLGQTLVRHIIRFGFVLLVLFTLIYYLPVPQVQSWFWFAGNQTIRLVLITFNIIFLLHYLSHAQKLPALVATVCGLILILEIIVWLPRPQDQQVNSQTYRVCTFNSQHSYPRQMLQHLQEKKIDIAFVTELSGKWVEYYRQALTQRGYHCWFSRLCNNYQVYNGIIARSELIPLDSLDLPSNYTSHRRCQIASTNLGGTEVLLGVCHLEPFLDQNNHRDFISSWKVRRSQAKQLAQYLAATDLPVILAGDLNSTPTEHCIKPIRKVLQDSWLTSGSGWGGTWESYLALFRIDYLFYRGFSDVTKGRTYRLNNSDHKLYQAEFSLGPK